MRYFIIKTGYGENEFIKIDESELETALYAFMSDSKGVFKNGVVRGKDIIAIREDWHREMGWNYTHVMEVEDWAELMDRGVSSKYAGAIQGAKEKVQYLMQTDQLNLLGKPVPEIDKKELSSGFDTSSLANKMKI
jgi:hypothetical protein